MKDFNIAQIINNNDEDRFVAVQEKISAMNISSISSNVQQSPTPENGHVAICQTKLVVDGKRSSMCGIATPDTSQSDKAHVLLADALCSSMTSAVSAIQNSASSTPPFTESAFSNDDRHFESPIGAKFKGKHNPNKAISEGQKSFILSLTDKEGQSVDGLAYSLCGKQNIDECSSADADKMIKRLQGKA